MGVTTTKTNKPLNPRGNDQSPLAYNRAKLYSGKALDFDGVNDVVNITTDDVDLQEFSVVQYVNLGATAASKIFYSNYAPTGNLGFATGISDSTANVPKFYTKGTSSNTLFGSFALNAGEWYQIVATYDGATKKIYVNGVLDTSVAFSDTILYTNATNQIGALSGGTAQALDGQLSNTKIFNTALTAAQVADLYNNPEKVVPTGVSNTALKLWLPMMEGAGTTAYDGSGNGNHGTISGATYVNGVGAPVSQSAVMDWNKGVNIISRSENAEHANWGKYFLTATDGETDPLGTNRAFEITENTGLQSRNLRSSDFSAVSGTQYYFSVIAKQGIGSRYLGFAGAGIAGASESPVFDLQNGSVDVGATNAIVKSASIEAYGSDGWYKCSMVYEANATTTYQIWLTMCQNATDNGTGNYSYVGNGTSSLFLFAPILKIGSAEGVYVQTIATTQPNPVLLPQGLTSGRDITGVNLFENVRKQGALNFDGNSWAEVHDNGSLDFGTGSFSLEIWSKAKYTSSGSIYNVLLTLGDNVSSGSTSSLYIDSSLNYTFRYDSTLIVAGGSSEGDWSHVVGVYDGTNINIYLNGSFVVQTAATASSKTNTYNKRIGTDTGGASRTYKDQIAQPRIYNRALTAEEVQRNYNAGKNTYTN